MSMSKIIKIEEFVMEKMKNPNNRITPFFLNEQTGQSKTGKGKNRASKKSKITSS